MTAHKFMLRHMRGVANGLAWPNHLFTQQSSFDSGALVDAAVDIAWERLRRGSGEAPLQITSQDGLLILRPTSPAPASGVGVPAAATHLRPYAPDRPALPAPSTQDAAC